MKNNNIKEPENKSVRTKPYYGEIEYEMPKAFAKELLKTRKGNEVNKPQQEFLCEVVNLEFGIKGNCTRVILT